MKKADTFEPLIQTHVSDWLREMWEVEAQHPPMIGSRLKLALWGPLPRAKKPKSAKKAAKTVKRAAAKK